MSEIIDKLGNMGAEKKALLAEKLRRARVSSSAAKGAVSVEENPERQIAVIGMACRFPGGATTPDQFFDLLMNRKSGVKRVPLDRFSIDDYHHPDPEAPGAILSDRGAFIENVTDFDATFFEISPREARRMDPQHRLLLEVAWESLENAGLSMESCRELLGGVFIGLMGNDYFATAQDCLGEIDAYVSTGTHYSFAANRISFHLDLKGPSMAIDSACSSSLVALHQACQNLRAGECDFAIAGGVNLILSPTLSISYSKWGMLSADGACKTFDARANGFVRGEGVGVVVLKRLADAVAQRDPILAVIRGSAVNQDGATSVITAPNGLAQQAVIRRALAMAGVDPSQVGYVETHGTGTSLGDPIEVEALGEIYGPAAADGECILGAVKTNVGHLEGAAGIAGFIKAVLAVRHGRIPPNLNFQKLNPLIRIEGTRLQLANEEREWKARERARFAAVSSFGAGGTNAHMVLQGYEAPARPAQASTGPQSFLIALSAKSERSLRKQADRLRGWMRRARDEGRPPALDDLSFTTLRRRSHFGQRAGFAVDSAASLDEALDAFLAGRADQRWSAGSGSLSAAKPVFVFAGQGSLWPGMGRELLAKHPRFAAELSSIDEQFRQLAGWSLFEVLSSDDQHAAARMSQTDVAQPCLFALQLALTACLEEMEIRPAAVVGHSVGEIAAACVAGAIDRGEAIELVFHRARLMQRLSGLGKMAAVGLAREEALARIQGIPQLALAAVNGPRSAVLAGEAGALEAVLAQLREEGRFARYLPVDYAFHSPQVEAITGELEHEVVRIFGRDTTLKQPRLPMISTVSGAALNASVAHRSYWVQNVRATVSFDQAIARLLDTHHDAFLEIGPHPALNVDLRESFLAHEATAQVVATLRRDHSPLRCLQAVPAGLYAAGLHPKHLPGPREGEVIPLPNYAWDRQRHWQGSPSRAAKGWSYELRWEEIAAAPRQVHQPGTWRIVGAMSGLAGVLIELLQAAGDSVTHTSIDALLTEAALPEGTRIVYVPAGPEANAELSDEARAEASCASLLRLVTGLEQSTTAGRGRVWVVTRGAQAVAAAEQMDPFAAPLWGLGRVLALEASATMGGLVDLPLHDNNETATVTAELLTVIRDSGREDQLALRAGRRYVSRLCRAACLQAAAPWELDERALYLVTGGTRGLGLRTAQHMARRGARRLALLGRQPLPPRELWPLLREGDAHFEATRAIRELEADGVVVSLYAADVGDARALRVVFEELDRQPFPLKGVIHAAGISKEVPASRVDAALLAETFAPKVTGTWTLHELCQGHTLDFFVVFSSAAAIWGSAGLAPYAAANEFLNAVAAHRGTLGQPALSICWGMWDAPGMATEQMRATWTKLGVRAMDPERAMRYLEELVVSGVNRVTVADVQWAQFRPIYELKRPRPLLAALDDETATAATRMKAASAAPVMAPRAGERTALQAELQKLPPELRRARLLRTLRDTAAQILGAVSAAEVNPEQGLFSMGFDSITAVELTGHLNRLFERKYEPTLLLDLSNLKQICDFVLRDCFRDSIEVVSSPTAPKSDARGDAHADELDALLAFVEGVDDEEAGRLLADEQPRLS